MADPEIVWHSLPDPGPHEGQVGKYVLAPVRVRGRAPGSDAELVLDEVFVSKFRNGRVIELREFRTKAEALEAVGLSEQDAHADS